MVVWKLFMRFGLVLLGMLLCWGLSSCSPWERRFGQGVPSRAKGRYECDVCRRDELRRISGSCSRGFIQALPAQADRGRKPQSDYAGLA